MKAIYFPSFYFRIFNSIREILENKNLTKISTYTVYWYSMSHPFIECVNE